MSMDHSSVKEYFSRGVVGGRRPLLKKSFNPQSKTGGWVIPHTPPSLYKFGSKGGLTPPPPHIPSAYAPAPNSENIHTFLCVYFYPFITRR